MKLSRQPCPDCGEDTVHSNMQCTRCGHVNLTNTEARIGFWQRRAISGRKTQFSAIRDVKALRREAAAKRIVWQVGVNMRGKGGTFGKRSNRSR